MLLKRYQPTLVFHLGDHISDVSGLRAMFPEVTVLAVPGNCDYAPRTAPVRVETIYGHTIYLAHGHAQRVKSGLQTLYLSAREQGATLALFGHTHMPCVERFGELTLMNPGSVARPRIGAPTFGLLEFSEARIETRILTV